MIRRRRSKELKSTKKASEDYIIMDWMRRQDIKEESQEAPNLALTPEDDDECYFEEETSIDEGMVCEL